MRAFDRAVVATVLAVDAAPEVSGDPAAARRVEEVAENQLSAMATHLQLGVGLIGTALSLVASATERRAFASLPLERRAALLDRWAAARLPGPALYVRLLRMLVRFASYEEAHPLPAELPASLPARPAAR